MGSDESLQAVVRQVEKGREKADAGLCYWPVAGVFAVVAMTLIMFL